MKGVMLSIDPGARIVDITHQVNPFEIMEAAFVLSEAYRYFPKKTVHLVVVDPGVGTSRRPLIAEAAGQYFVAPDNGVLSMVYSREKHKVRSITNEKYFLKPVSETFHGRDVFAPVAARLAKGMRPAAFGELCNDYLRQEFEKPVRTGKRVWSGTILKVDRFGNLITNFHVSEFAVVRTRPFAMNVGQQQVSQIARTYAESKPGEPVLIVGSSGFLEVAYNQESAARRIGCTVGSPVELTVY
jgi:S-adenosylmethionine hydrolase